MKWIELKPALMAMKHPEPPIKLGCEIINDVPLFIKTHSNMIENNGGRVAIPYWSRLLNYYRTYGNKKK